MDTNKSSTANDGTTSDLLASVKEIKKQTITAGGIKYYAVTKDTVKSLEDRVDRMLARQGGSNSSPSELIALADEIDELRKGHTKLQADLKARDITVKEYIESLKEMKHDYNEATKNAAELKRANSELQTDLREQAKKAKADIVAAKAALGSPEAKFDPEARLALEDALKAAVEESNTLQRKLEELNNTQRKSQAKLHSLLVEIKEKETDINALKGQATQLRNAVTRASETSQRLEFSPAIEKLLGKEACLILAGWQMTTADSVKDRAYVGMKGLSNHKNKLLRAIGKLFTEVYLWCKEQTNKARQVVRPWIDMVIEDVMAAKIRTVAFYRDELAKLKVIVKEKQEQRQRQGIDTDNEGFFSDLWFYGYAIALRVRRRTTPLAVKVWRTVKGSSFVIVQSLRNWKNAIHMAFSMSIDGKSHAEMRVQAEVHRNGWIPSLKRAFWSAWPENMRPGYKKRDKEIFVTEEDAAPFAAPA